MFFTWSEAVKVFIDAGLSESTLRRRVNEGAITATLPVGRQRGRLYPKAQVVAALPQKASKQTIEADISSATDWVREYDLPSLLKLDYEMYGIEATVDISITYAWWQKNPFMCRILFDKNNRENIWGAITIMPMREETIFKILRDELREKDIKPDDILVYEKPGKYDGYISSATARPEHSQHFRKLLESIFDFWCEQYPHIQLTRLYAFAASEKGLDLIHHLFFSPRYDLGENAFEIDPYRRNPSKLIKSFQRCLDQKKIDNNS